MRTITVETGVVQILEFAAANPVGFIGFASLVMLAALYLVEF